MTTSPEAKMKKALIIARAFPPFRPVGYSIRVVKFIKYLPTLGWLPFVLTVDGKREYESLRKMGSEALLSEIPSEVRICRSTPGEPSLEFLEKEIRFSKKNRLAAFIVKLVSGARRWVFRNLLPDRQVTWLPFAMQMGLQIVKKEGIDVIFATCPPFSDALIGALLKLLTGKPLVLDFRDDWIETPWYDSKSKISRAIERGMEGWAVRTAHKVILVTEWSQKAFIRRYPDQPKEKFLFLPNGCDLDDIVGLNSTQVVPGNAKFTILHAGSLNDAKLWARSPSTLFQAISNILKQQPEMAGKLEMVFAGDFTKRHRELAEEMGLSNIVKELGHLPHTDVLRLIKSADLLLAINYEGFSTLIPGKIYEYWAVGGPPILFLSCRGAAQELIEKKELGITVPPDDVQAIEHAISTVYNRSVTGNPIQISAAGVEEYDRKTLTGTLAQVLSSTLPDKK